MKTSFFTNPWVLGGGAILGIVILLNRGGGSGESQATSAGMINDMNAMALSANVQLAGIAMQQAGMRYEYDAVIAGHAFEAMINRVNATAEYLMTQSAGRAGIVNAAIVGNTMAIQDRQTMLNEMELYRVESDPAFTRQMENPGASTQLQDSHFPRDTKYQRRERAALGFGRHLTDNGFDGWSVLTPKGTA